MNKLIEKWCPIKDFEGLYEVSNYSRIRSIKRDVIFYRNGKQVKRTFGGIFLKKHFCCGYERVRLRKNGKYYDILVHRLVAEAFIPNPEGYPQVNHKDENKTNNFVLNLEWCTAEYNMNYGTRNERSGEKLKNCKATSKQVFQCAKDGTLIKVWPSVSECGRNGYNVSAVASCCRGERITHKKYKWSYV